MPIGIVSSVAGLQQQSNIRKTDEKLQAAIASLVSGRKTQDVADVAVASQLQSEVAGLKQVSQSLAQASSLTQVADGALSQSQAIVGRLQEIALQSSNGALNDEQRVALNEEFQSLIGELDRQVANTQFNGKNLLDGTLAGDNKLSLSNLLKSEDESGDNALEIEDLSSKVLFGGTSPNVLSADAASQALSLLGTAQNTISVARASVGAFQQTLNFAAASIDSAIINQEAARALLSDADFLEAATESQQAQVQRNAQLSIAAQTNRLPAALVQLLAG
ncbi:MAG: flagellin [Alphaproteobacteria bacterium]|nr:flagellin [Alphaproteobacteria bacterium]